MRSLLLQGADPVHLFLEVAVVMATEIAASVVLQPLPVQHCLLLNHSLCLALNSLLLLNAQLLV